MIFTGLTLNNNLIPDNNHIARFCFKKYVSNGQVQGSAFFLRENEEYLSVNWLEYFQCNRRNEEISKIRYVYSQKFTRPRPGSKDRIAVLNVGKTRKHVQSESDDHRNLEFIHLNKADPSYSGIYNLRPDNEMIAELIRETIIESHSAI